MDEWCQEQDIHLAVLGFNYKKYIKPPKRIRCHKCKKRFKTFIKECDDIGCFHLYFPKHKFKKTYLAKKK